MFGFRATPQPPQGPWSGLPTAPQPWAGSSQVWQPAQQAPWRLSPWQTQGMPPGAPPPTMAPAQAPAAPAANPYLSQGMSTGIPGFNPMTPGGGMYPSQPQAPAAPMAPAGPNEAWIGAQGMLHGDPFGAAASIQAYNQANEGFGTQAPVRVTGTPEELAWRAHGSGQDMGAVLKMYQLQNDPAMQQQYSGLNIHPSAMGFGL